MDEGLIWTRDDIVRFSRDARVDIRGWAWHWLSRHHPLEAGRQAARGVADPHTPIALEALLAFEAHPTPEAVKVVEDLRGRPDVAPAVRAAIEAVRGSGSQKDWSDLDPWVIECQRLADAPEELKRRAPGMLLGKSYQDHLLVTAALGKQQHRWAADILLEHFAALLTIRDDTEVWAALDDLRDPRFLPAILAAWVPTQRRAACLYATIHDLAGLSGPLPPGIARDIEDEARYSRDRDAFRAAHPKGVSWAGVRRHAACYACGRTGEYERAIPVLLDRLFPGHEPGKKPRSLGESGVMTCKFCGARNADRLEPISMTDTDEVDIEEEEATSAEEGEDPRHRKN